MVNHVPERQHNGKCRRAKPPALRTIIISKRCHPPVLAAGLLIAAWSATPAAHLYTMTLDDELENMTVEARFDRPVDYISARSRYAPQFLRNARDCASGTALRSRSRFLQMPVAGLECLSYTVNLRDAAAATRLSGILDHSNIVVSPTLWMWRPRLAN